MELGSKSESSEPRPDIHDLFSHYNALYFDDALGACIVYWSDARTARSAGMCCYLEEGLCEIRLSEPLLKFRSTADLKNTLLHEMVHAFLYITGNKKDHSYHGPSFLAKVNAINSSTVTDHQRPLDGYNIKLSHDFSNELNVQGLTHYKPCGDMFEGTVNAELLVNDCIGNSDHNKSCRNLSCLSNRHKMLWSGRFRKTETSGDKGKISTIEDGRENKGDKSNGSSHMTRHSKRKLQNPEQMNLSDVKKTKYDGPTTSGTKSLSCSTRNSQQRVTDKRTKLSSVDALDAKIPKKPRTSRSKRHDVYDFMKIELAEKKNLDECKRRETVPVANRWFACYGDEESEDDVEPLVNNRTERRKREKLLKLQYKRIQDSVVYILDDDDDGDDDDDD